MAEYLVTTPRPLGVLVITNDQHVITGGAPFIRTFHGQSIARLLNWLRAVDGDYAIHRLPLPVEVGTAAALGLDVAIAALEDR